MIITQWVRGTNINFIRLATWGTFCEENIFRYCGVGTTAQLRHILITGIVIDAILMVLNNCIFMHATKNIEPSLHTYNLTVYFACKILLNNNYSNYWISAFRRKIVIFSDCRHYYLKGGTSSRKAIGKKVMRWFTLFFIFRIYSNSECFNCFWYVLKWHPKLFRWNSELYNFY